MKADKSLQAGEGRSLKDGKFDIYHQPGVTLAQKARVKQLHCSVRNGAIRL